MPHFFGVEAHRAELEHAERASAEANTLLAKEGSPLVVTISTSSVTSMTGDRSNSTTKAPAMSQARLSVRI